MKYPHIVYIKNKVTQQYEFKYDITTVVRSDKGYFLTFNSGNTYHYGEDRVQYFPLLSSLEQVCIYEKGQKNTKYTAVDNYGPYLVYRKGDSKSLPVENGPDIEIHEMNEANVRATSLLHYFKEILKNDANLVSDVPKNETEEESTEQTSNKLVLKVLDIIDVFDSQSVLSRYLAGEIPSDKASPETLIYPFGCNESQKLAVEMAMNNSISVVEGPPGTGKTQTILNLIANIIVQGKTVAIVSNNNAAVDNVKDKLENYGYGVFVASLGRRKNKEIFFEKRKSQSLSKDFELTREEMTRIKKEIRGLEAKLTKCFQNRNKLSVLKADEQDAKIEFAHHRAEQPLGEEMKQKSDGIFHRPLTSPKALILKKILDDLSCEKKFSFRNKLRWLMNFGLRDREIARRNREELYVYVNHKIYELYLAKIEREVFDLEIFLASNDEKKTLAHYVDLSKKIFGGILYEKYTTIQSDDFTLENYCRRFQEFTKRYPLTLSTAQSLPNSIPKNYLFDYLIIDEASQVDIIKAAVCFSRCRRVVVVGDCMQLTHIVSDNSKEFVKKYLRTYPIHPAYDYAEHNILNSLKVLYGDKIKSVMLKEHYRCHPAIIGFCNKKYYNNKLVIMTENEHHPFKIIETNIGGYKEHCNMRQIEETNNYIKKNYTDRENTVGVISPYRGHAEKLKEKLPKGVEADTIHKFQGREKDTVIFNTVRDQIVDFIDNPNLINVAVSRAVNEFVVVKPASMELPHGTHIGDLIRYITYVVDREKTMVKGEICSVFDILYKEYSKSFVTFIKINSTLKGSPAEKIIHDLLRKNTILKSPQFSSIDMIQEYRLRDLVNDYEVFSEDCVKYIRSNSRIDFLLYNKIDKTPVLAIEVDGVSFHTQALQRARDQKKDHILQTIGLPLLRLSTAGHQEEERIIESLNKAMGRA